MQLVDRLVSYWSPVSAVRRMQARQALAYYEAAKPSKYRKSKRAPGDADTAVRRAGANLREQARFLEQNHDLARGVLAILVQNTVGAEGIMIEPQPRLPDGTIHEEFAREILEAWRDWSKRPEVTWEHDWAACQRLGARSMFRDGEVFAQQLLGSVVGLDHGTRVPFSLELIESDLVPMSHTRSAEGVDMGVRRNAWGRPIEYFVFKNHPGGAISIPTVSDLKTIPAERMLHLKLVDRIRQVRGVSIFASVLTRLDDIKDYEESERVAAKVAASMAAAIIKGTPEFYSAADSDDAKPRELKFTPGMVFDDLMPGESVTTIDTSRPNTNLEAHRSGQIRMVAAGTTVSASSVSRNYDGSYSSQRQELVESWGAYAILSNLFAGRFVRPVYENFLRAALVSGELSLPAEVSLSRADDALYIGPQMPWIDPDKESKSFERLEKNFHASGPEIIRRRGRNPREVLEAQRNWLKQRQKAGLSDESKQETGSAKKTSSAIG